MDVACADPLTDGKDVWGIQEHYVMDYTQPAAKQANWVGYSLDRHKYPNDPRGLMFVKQQGEHGLTSPQIVYLNGRRFMFVGGMFASQLHQHLPLRPRRPGGNRDPLWIDHAMGQQPL